MNSLGGSLRVTKLSTEWFEQQPMIFPWYFPPQEDDMEGMLAEDCPLWPELDFIFNRTYKARLILAEPGPNDLSLLRRLHRIIATTYKRNHHKLWQSIATPVQAGVPYHSTAFCGDLRFTLDMVDDEGRQHKIPHRFGRVPSTKGLLRFPWIPETHNNPRRIQFGHKGEPWTMCVSRI